jgi:hypothetical protein
MHPHVELLRGCVTSAAAVRGAVMKLNNQGRIQKAMKLPSAVTGNRSNTWTLVENP